MEKRADQEVESTTPEQLAELEQAEARQGSAVRELKAQMAAEEDKEKKGDINKRIQQEVKKLKAAKEATASARAACALAVACFELARRCKAYKNMHCSRIKPVAEICKVQATLLFLCGTLHCSTAAEQCAGGTEQAGWVA